MDFHDTHDKRSIYEYLVSSRQIQNCAFIPEGGGILFNEASLYFLSYHQAFFG